MNPAWFKLAPRDLLAALALPAAKAIVDDAPLDRGGVPEEIEIAREAYALADAMLRVREEKKP